MSVTIYAPASIGNVSVGFDLLGAAITPINGDLLGDRVTVEKAGEDISLNLIGRWANKLPEKKKDNIVYKCAEFFLNFIGEKKGLVLTLEKNLPVGSGLGSSASSIVATLAALNIFFEKPLGSYELLKLMGTFEGKISGSVHYDNVAPSYLGGMQLMVDSPKTLSEGLPQFKQWYWVIAYPGISLSTSIMRNLLPKKIDRQTTIDFGRNLSTFILASYKQDANLALGVLKDVLAEPYRAEMIPKFLPAKKVLEEIGMLATGISGSGPTLFSVTDDLDIAKKAQDYLNANYIEVGRGFSHICQIDNQGAREMK